MIKRIRVLTSRFKVKKAYLIIPVVVVLIMGLVLGGIFFARPYISNKLTQKSSADLKIEEKKLKLNFNITANDRQVAESFINNLGADRKVFEGISLELDDQSLTRLQPILPVRLTLDFSSNKLSFYNLSLPKLNSGVAGDVVNFSTESGRLRMSSKGNVFHLEIEDPNPLMKYATESGQLQLSKKLDLLFSILSKVGRMRLDVDGKSLSGEIQLK
jgi:hypothetical protein